MEILPRSNRIHDVAGKDSAWRGSSRPSAVKSKWGADSTLLNAKSGAPVSSPMRQEAPGAEEARTPTREQSMSPEDSVNEQPGYDFEQPAKEHPEMAEDLSNKPLLVKLFYNFEKDWIFTDFYINSAATLEEVDDESRDAPSDLHSGYKANGSFYSPTSAGPAYNWPKGTFYPLSPVNDTDKRNLLDTDYEPGQRRPSSSPRSDSPAVPRTPSPTAKPSSPMWTSTTASSPTSSSDGARSTAASSRYKSDFSSASSSEDVLSDTSDPALPPDSEPAPAVPKRPISEAAAVDSAASGDALQAWVNSSGPDAQDDASVAAGTGMRRKRVSFATLPDIQEQATAEAAAAPAAPTPPTAAAATPAAATKAPVAPSRQSNLDSISARFAAVTASLDLRLGTTPRRSSEAAAIPVATPAATTASRPPRPAVRSLTASPLLEAQSRPERDAPQPRSLDAPTTAATARSTPFAAATASSPTAVAAAAAAAAATPSDNSSVRSESPEPTSTKSWSTDEEADEADEAADAVPELPQYQQQYLAYQQHQRAQQQQPLQRQQPDASRRAGAATAAAQPRGSAAPPMSAAAAAAARVPGPLKVERSGESVTEMVLRSSASVTVKQMEHQSLKHNGYEPARGFWSWWMWNRTATVTRQSGFVPHSVLGIERAMLQKKEPTGEPEVEARNQASHPTPPGKH